MAAVPSMAVPVALTAVPVAAVTTAIVVVASAIGIAIVAEPVLWRAFLEGLVIGSDLLQELLAELLGFSNTLRSGATGNGQQKTSRPSSTTYAMCRNMGSSLSWPL